MEDKNNTKELAFTVPTDISFEGDVTSLSDSKLQREHDMMHVFFKKLEEGLGQFRDFNWTFNKVIVKHSQIVEEMLKRGIPHHTPINNLDSIIPGKEIKSTVMELAKQKEEKVTLSFDGPARVEKEKDL